MTPVMYFPHLGYVGRLGNALFELASTVGLARREGVEPRFNHDWIHRPYFSVPDEFFTPAPNEATIDPVGLCTHIDERTRIYMQDVSLFVDVLDEIRSYLKPSLDAQEIMAPAVDEFHRLRRPILSMHVRRGDNVPGQDPGVPNKEEYYILPSLDYYCRALTELYHQCSSIAVFSDDPQWCEERFGFADYIHHGLARPKEHEDDFLTAPVADWVDLQLMATCDYHVVTGSTFGIWGALLAETKGAVRPTPVYGPALPYVPEDLLFPTSWKVLPC